MCQNESEEQKIVGLADTTASIKKWRTKTCAIGREWESEQVKNESTEAKNTILEEQGHLNLQCQQTMA